MDLFEETMLLDEDRHNYKNNPKISNWQKSIIKKNGKRSRSVKDAAPPSYTANQTAIVNQATANSQLPGNSSATSEQIAAPATQQTVNTSTTQTQNNPAANKSTAMQVAQQDQAFASDSKKEYSKISNSIKKCANNLKNLGLDLTEVEPLINANNVKIGDKLDYLISTIEDQLKTIAPEQKSQVIAALSNENDANSLQHIVNMKFQNNATYSKKYWNLIDQASGKDVDRIQQNTKFLSRNNVGDLLLSWGWTPDQASLFAQAYSKALEKTKFALQEANENVVKAQNNQKNMLAILDAIYQATLGLDFLAQKRPAIEAAYRAAKQELQSNTQVGGNKTNTSMLKKIDAYIESMLKIGEPFDPNKLTSEEKKEVEDVNEKIEDETPPVDDNKPEDQQDPQNEPSDPTKGYLIWPANPYLNISGITGQNIKAAEKLIADDITPAKNVYLYIPKKGADGDFCNSAIEDYLCSKLGLSSGLGVKQYKIITQIATFVQNCKGENQTKTQFAETARERMRNRLFEGDTKVLNKSSSSSPLKTTAAAQGSPKQTNVSPDNSNVLTIYCTPRIGKYFEQNKQLFDKIGMSLNIKTDLFKDDTEALEEGQTIFKDILTFNNGTKNFSAGKQDTKDTMTSLSKQNASYIDNRNRLFEGDDNAPAEGEDESLSKDSDASNWAWENIKANDGAKDFLKRIQTDVNEIEGGLDDGGNPSKLVGMAKAALATWGKTWGAAVGDAADFFAESFGLGWIMPALKASAEKYRSSEEEYDGIEAFVRSKYSKSLLNAAEDPDFYIQKGSPRK